MAKQPKPWSPTVDQIKSIIMATKDGYGLTQETNENGTKHHLIIWKDGREQSRFIADSAQLCFRMAYSAMVREGKIHP